MYVWGAQHSKELQRIGNDLVWNAVIDSTAPIRLGDVAHSPLRY